jgi:hypothetical protein
MACMNPPLDDYRWLVSADADVWLREYAQIPSPTVADVRRLRRALSATRTHLVVELCALRRRAAAKFESADRFFFTRQALEQATDRSIAGYKATRFPRGKRLVDLCCGIGGDLLALATQSLVEGVDRDPVLALLAAANARVLELAACTVHVADASTWHVVDYAGWHIDPDRRPAGRRTSGILHSEPPATVLENLWRTHPHGAIKLAPAADLPDAWSTVCERQWLGSGRECRQQVAWFGDLAHAPGQRTATVVDRQGRPSPPLAAGDQSPCALATRIGRYVHEPHACVLAARLTGALAQQLGLCALAPGTAYLTGDDRLEDPRAASFEVAEVLPFDRRRLRSLLAARGIGRLEIKLRGVPLDPRQLQQQLRGRGEESAVLLLTPWAGSVHAVLARRTNATASDGP